MYCRIMFRDILVCGSRYNAYLFMRCIFERTKCYFFAHVCFYRSLGRHYQMSLIMAAFLHRQLSVV